MLCTGEKGSGSTLNLYLKDWTYIFFKLPQKKNASSCPCSWNIIAEVSVTLKLVTALRHEHGAHTQQLITSIRHAMSDNVVQDDLEVAPCDTPCDAPCDTQVCRKEHATGTDHKLGSHVNLWSITHKNHGVLHQHVIFVCVCFPPHPEELPGWGWILWVLPSLL